MSGPAPEAGVTSMRRGHRVGVLLASGARPGAGAGS